MSSAFDPDQETEIINLAVIEELRELGGEDEPGLLLELIEIFLSDAPNYLREMTRAFDDGDLKRMERAAHTLKSSSANMGSTVLRELCLWMEDAARRGDSETYQQLTEPCSIAYREFEGALRKIR